MKSLKKVFALILVVCVFASTCLAAEQSDPVGVPISPSGSIGDIVSISPTGTIGEFAETRAIDQIVSIKGSPLFNESNHGAYYYAFSGASTTYSEAFANIKLPTSMNYANGTRHAFISLGIYGSKHGIDLGIMNTGSGWYPVYYDVTVGGEVFPAYTAPSNATNAKIVVKPVNNTTVHMYVQFLNSSGANVGTPFDKDIRVQAGNLTGTAGNISCRFYRFASLVPNNGVDNQRDSSYMLGGQFTNLGLYNKNSRAYDTWGIGTARVTNAWKCSPERITLSYTANSDTFKIDHWA